MKRPSDSSPEPAPARPAASEEEFRALLPALECYVYSLMLDRDAVRDVVQETMLFVLGQRPDLCGEDLRAYSFRTAWFKVMSHRRDRQRSRLVHVSDELLQRISAASEPHHGEEDSRLEALRGCLGKLRHQDRELLRLRYLNHGAITDHARERGMSPNRLQKAVSRLRLTLRHCVETRLKPRP